mmetsp:Transcript_128011/g.221189  ORF Transcript_128011/g.221189 Transcript_128011/m.221189 type:complete len:213 (+) Transcript_128011:1041-1679(+)
MAGSMNAKVLPHPVSAIPMQSRPSKRIGHAWDCTGVGLGKAAFNSFITFMPKSTPANLMTGFGASFPTSTSLSLRNLCVSAADTLDPHKYFLNHFTTGFCLIVRSSACHTAGGSVAPSFHNVFQYFFSFFCRASRFSFMRFNWWWIVGRLTRQYPPYCTSTGEPLSVGGGTREALMAVSALRNSTVAHPGLPVSTFAHVMFWTRLGDMPCFS